MKISILMPVYNEEAYIAEAVRSVKQQTVGFEYELIVVDDFSTDSTLLVLQELAQECTFLKILRNIEKGKNSAFNLAYQNCSGDVIALFAGDDVLPEGALALRVEPLHDSLNQAVVSVCKLQMFSAIKKFDGVVTPRDRSKGAMSGGAMMFTRKFAELCFPLPTLLANEDQWIVCHAKYFGHVEVRHVPEVGLKYRIHDSNSSTRTAKFKEKNASMHSRFIVYSVFLERYRTALSVASIDQLSRTAAAETLRFNGSSLSLLLMKGIGMSEKARFFMHSHKLLYWLRIQLFSLLSGR